MKKLNRKGFTLVEIILVISIGIAIVAGGLYATHVWFKTIEGKKNISDIEMTLKNAAMLSITNKPDGSNKIDNPLTLDILKDNNSLPYSFEQSAEAGYFVPSIGQIAIGYAEEYPNANVIEFKILGNSIDSCIALISNSHKFLEVKIDKNYLYSSKRTNQDGSEYYTTNMKKSLELCKNAPSAAVTRVRYYLPPDFNKIYTPGGDIAGTNDPKAPERNEQIKAFKEAYNYVNQIKKSHIVE